MSFPAELEDGTIVQIVEKVFGPEEKVLLRDEAGKFYQAHPSIGQKIVPYVERLVEDAESAIGAVETVLDDAKSGLESVDARLHGLGLEPTEPPAEEPPAGEAEAAPVTEPEAAPIEDAPEADTAVEGDAPEDVAGGETATDAPVEASDESDAAPATEDEPQAA